MPANTVAPLLSIDTLMKFDGLETIITGIVAFYIFLWILSIVRVSRDIYARTNSVVVQLISILLITFLSPIIGLPLYITLRPVRYKPRRNNNIAIQEYREGAPSISGQGEIAEGRRGLDGKVEESEELKDWDNLTSKNEEE